MTSDLVMRYLARTGYVGPTTVSRVTLDALILQHVRTIPFENVDQFCGGVVDVSVPGIDAKLLRARRGGYCLEHNQLLRAVLDELGYATRAAEARVTWAKPADAKPSGRGHLVTVVSLRDPATGHTADHVADVGFGTVSLTTSLSMTDATPRTTALERFKTERTDRGTTVAVELQKGWRPMYTIEDSRVEQADVEVNNWFLCTNPDSVFRRKLIVARVRDDHRLTLNDRTLTRYCTGEAPQRRVLSPDEVLAALVDLFDITVPDPSMLRANLARLPSVSP